MTKPHRANDSWLGRFTGLWFYAKLKPLFGVVQVTFTLFIMKNVKRKA
jgi:hypothetical protein